MRTGVQPGSGYQSRLAAADLLLRIERGESMAGAMASSSRLAPLSGADRRFARSMAGATLRGCGRVDMALAQLSNKPLSELDDTVLALLRVGAAQLWLLGVPPYAAVATTVEAARAMPQARRAGALINAILRRAATSPDLFTATPELAVWPDWLQEAMILALGPERAVMAAKSQLVEPALDIQPVADAPSWAERLKGTLVAGGVRLSFGRAVTELDGYAEGAWWVQDAAAALAVRLFGDVTGMRVLDMCAAPGGKTMQLAAAGAIVTALDIAEARIRILHDNLARTGLCAEIVQDDARKYMPEQQFDAILLDAPCSALGTFRRHPEALMRPPRPPEHFAKCQTELLHSAQKLLRRGGKLVYCVCTPVAREGSEIIEAALAQKAWRRCPLADATGEEFSYAITDQGDILTAPDREGKALASDIFYMAMLERI